MIDKEGADDDTDNAKREIYKRNCRRRQYRAGNTTNERRAFFAGILGEVVAPSPITRSEKYLAKIANKYSGELPEPVTRIERFLARAAGMNVSTPTPVTREEMFWADYALIVEKEISGIPPLTFNAIAGTLKNYRIYGNTVDGESVGDRTGNLFDGSWENKYIDTYGNIGYSTDRVLSSYVTVIPNQTYSVKSNMRIRAVHSYNDTTHTQTLIDNVAGLDGATFTIPADSNSIRIALKKANDGMFTPDDIDWFMLNAGSTALPYEPYGYRVPVTVNDIITNIYLDEPLAKSGNNADYIDYATQKRHNSDGTESSVTLPEIAVAVGTNTLTVGAEVQPSNVYIKYEG